MKEPLKKSQTEREPPELSLFVSGDGSEQRALFDVSGNGSELRGRLSYRF